MGPGGEGGGREGTQVVYFVSAALMIPEQFQEERLRALQVV